MSLFLSSPSAVMFCGSRSLSDQHRGRVSSLVVAAASSGAVLVTGCASGADQLVVAAAMCAGYTSDLRLFAIGSAAGQHFTRAASAYAPVYRASLQGAQVTWWAGGGELVPLRARLARRSQAAVSFTAAQGPGAICIGLVSSLPPHPFSVGAWPSCGSGSWSSLAMAARLGLSVLLVPVAELAGVQALQLPLLSARGHWQGHQPVDGVSGFLWQGAALF